MTEDGDPSTAVYFHENETPCTQPCTSISVDPSKVEYELTFKIQSTFSQSNDQLIYKSPEITFKKASCPDCTNPLNPNDGSNLNYFTLIEPAESVIAD